MHARLHPLKYLVILACGFGLSASALQQPGGFPETAVTEPATRLVYSGPMPAWEEPVARVQPRLERSVVDKIWVAPPVPQPVSLPSIPDYELISDAKVARVKGLPFLADVQLGRAEPAEPPLGRPFMTRLPRPALAAPVSDGAAVFCEGSC